MALTFANSHASVLSHPRMILYGAPGCGKTVAAASISKYFPQEIFAGKRPAQHVVLKDTLFVSWDNGGLDSLAEHNISAPVLQFRKGEKIVAPDHSLVSGGEILLAIPQIVQDLKVAVETMGIENIVIDTTSTMDQIMEGYFQNKFVDDTDKRQMWGQFSACFGTFIGGLRSLNATIIFTAHTRDQVETKGKEKDIQVAKRMADGQKEDGNVITFAITGKSYKTLNGICSLVLPITATPVMGKIKRSFHPHGHKDLSFKSRFQTLLGREEPTNLRTLLDNLRQKISALGPEGQGSEAQSA